MNSHGFNLSVFKIPSCLWIRQRGSCARTGHDAIPPLSNCGLRGTCVSLDSSGHHPDSRPTSVSSARGPVLLVGINHPCAGLFSASCSAQFFLLRESMSRPRRQHYDLYNRLLVTQIDMPCSPRRRPSSRPIPPLRPQVCRMEENERPCIFLACRRRVVDPELARHQESSNHRASNPLINPV